MLGYAHVASRPRRSCKARYSRSRRDWRRDTLPTTADGSRCAGAVPSPHKSNPVPVADRRSLCEAAVGAGNSNSSRLSSSMPAGSGQLSPAEARAPQIIMHDAIVLIPNIRAMTRSVRHCCLEGGTFLFRRINNFGVGTCSWRIPLHRRGGKRSDNNLARVFDLFPSLRERRSQMAPWGGEHRMLMLGLALMMRHSLPLMDEPSIGLAPRVTADVFGSIARLKDPDGTNIWWNR